MAPGDGLDLPEFGHSISPIPGGMDIGIEPEFRVGPAPRNVNMPRFSAVGRIEVETIRPEPEDGGHAGGLSVQNANWAPGTPCSNSSSIRAASGYFSRIQSYPSASSFWTSSGPPFSTIRPPKRMWTNWGWM